MKLTLERIVNGQPVTESLDIHPASALGVMVQQHGGWPEVLIRGSDVFTIDSFDPIEATYRQATSCTL